MLTVGSAPLLEIDRRQCCSSLAASSAGPAGLIGLLGRVGRHGMNQNRSAPIAPEAVCLPSRVGGTGLSPDVGPACRSYPVFFPFLDTGCVISSDTLFLVYIAIYS